MEDMSHKLVIVDDMNEIHFSGGITKVSCFKIIQSLLTMENKILCKSIKLKRKIDDLLVDNKNSINILYSPIKLFISCTGIGSAFQALSVVDTIHGMTVPVHTICKGMVSSLGVVISLSGAKRYITKNSYVQLRQIDGCTYGNHEQLIDEFQNLTLLANHLKGIYLEKTKLSDAELIECLKNNIIWDAHMCLDKGLVDEIL